MQFDQDFAWLFVHPEVDPDIRSFDLSFFDPVEFVQLLHNTLSHGSFTGFGPEAFHQPFILADIILLVFVGFLLHLYADGFFFFVVIVITSIDMQLLLVHFHDLGHHPVQEVFIVTHDHHRSLVMEEVFFQPFDGGQVKVVGRFIKQEQIGLLKDHFGQ